MKGEVKHLANNERYRILIINGKTYIMDIEKSFWKIIFPFLFWLMPNPVYRVENQAIVEKLQTEKMKRRDLDGKTAGIGIAYVGGMSLVPLADYFDVPMTPLVKSIVMLFSIILVGLIYYNLSRKSENTMKSVVELEKLSTEQIKIRPSSFKHFLYVLIAYVFWLIFDYFAFRLYFTMGNILVLIVASGFLFVFLMVNKMTIKEGYATIKISNDK